MALAAVDSGLGRALVPGIGQKRVERVGAGSCAECTHDPACPTADAIDWWAARNIIQHPGQGWTLLCNGALVFDDLGALLPDGRVAAISDGPRARLRCAT